MAAIGRDGLFYGSASEGGGQDLHGAGGTVVPTAQIRSMSAW